MTEIERIDFKKYGDIFWKEYLKERIKKCDIFICLIGEETHDSIEVKEELDIASSLGIKIVPVRIPGTNGAAPIIIGQKRIMNWDAREINDELSRSITKKMYYSQTAV